MTAGAVSVAFAPLVPWWAIAALAAAAAALLGVGLAARAPGSGWRALAALALLAALANPSAVHEAREPIKDVAVLVVDESPSQEVTDRLDRTRAAVAEIRRRAERFRDSLELRTVRVAHDTIADGAKGTRLVGALREALADVPARRFAGAILVTDGQVHDVPAAVADGAADGDGGGAARGRDAAAGLPGPVHALIVGEEETVDRRLEVVEAPGYGLVGEPLTMRVRVADPTAAPGTRARVTVAVDGEPKRGRQVRIGEVAEIEITPDHRGESIVELATPERPGEVSAVNNRAVIAVNGVRDRLRVLLVSGQPHPGERTWRNLLKSDPSVDLVHFTILRPPEKQDGTPIHELSLIAFPTRELFEIKLDEFDLVVFDRYRRRGVLPTIYLNNVVQYVREGGALLQAVGPGFAGPFSLFRTELGSLMPGAPTGAVIERGFKPAVTGVGRRHPVTADLPGGPADANGAGSGAAASGGGAGDGPAWGRWFRQIETDARAGETLMTGLDGLPLLMLDRVGEGRIAQMNSDHIWLWARGYEGGGPQAELLRRLAHWLMKEPELEEEALTAKVRGDRLTVDRRTLKAREAPTVTVTGPTGETRELSLARTRAGRFEGVMPVERTGLYTVRDGERTAMAAAGALNPLEMAELSATGERLAPLVEATGGSVIRLAGGDGADGAPPEVPGLRRVAPDRNAGGADWFGLTRNGDYVVTGVTSAPAMPGWFLLIAGLALFAAAWRREAR